MNNCIVQTAEGYLCGLHEKNINGTNFFAFRGVPYAKPPVGDLRFKDSEPGENWFGVKDAFDFGGMCAQRNEISGEIVGGDDCLYLNVYTPTLNPPIPKPVMVWIHGGGYLTGSSNDDLYGPDYLIEKDIVLITINYRFGILGFLNLGDEEAPGNQGLKDQIQALKWTQRNISQFGGDPNNVTIFGASAGAISTYFLSISPLSQGLFHKTIIQSLASVNPEYHVSRLSAEVVKNLANFLNKKFSNSKVFANYLRTLTPCELIQAQEGMMSRKEKILFIHPFQISIDSKAKIPLFPTSINEAAENGIRIPCIFGYVSHEAFAFPILSTKNIGLDEIEEDPDTYLCPPDIKEYLGQYNITPRDMKRIYFGNEKITTEKLVDLINTTHTIMYIQNALEVQKKILNTPTYFYKFEYELELSAMKKLLGVDGKGTFHGDDLAFLFLARVDKAFGRSLPLPGSIEHCIMLRFTEMWTNFAKIGNPTPQTTNLIPVIWEPIDNSSEFKILKITDKLIMDTEKNILQQMIAKLND